MQEDKISNILRDIYEKSKLKVLLMKESETIITIKPIFEKDTSQAEAIPIVYRTEVEGGYIKAMKKQLPRIKQCKNGLGRIVRILETCYGKKHPFEVLTCTNCYWFDGLGKNETCEGLEFTGVEIRDSKSYNLTELGIPPKKRWRILEKYQFTCQYCGRKPPEVIIEIDHILPLSKGGSNDESNLIVACKTCNSGKGGEILRKK